MSLKKNKKNLGTLPKSRLISQIDIPLDPEANQIKYYEMSISYLYLRNEFNLTKIQNLFFKKRR